jgi:hypothetical protein
VGAKTAGIRFKAALLKMGQEGLMPVQEPLPGQPSPEEAAPQPVPEPAPTAPEPTAQMQPVNFMGAEMLAQRAQEANESNFYRDRLGKAVAEVQQLQQQTQQMQQAVEQLQQQQAASGVQVQTATQQAVEANDRALQQTQQAANLRMGMQQLRERMLQLASEEPAAVTAQNQVQQQEALAGTPEASPEPGGGAPPGSTPAGAGGPEASPAAPGKQESSKGEPKPAGEKGQKEASLKSMLGYGAVGAGVGLAGGLMAARATAKAEERVRQLEAQGQEGFPAAVELAKAKLELARAQRDEQQPIRTTLREAGKGAVGGALLGPALAGQFARATGI